ncbi:hypothetical protein [Streptomyces sp. SAI-127]|uniref:hypothetical protein n=1 Tax=Streptomyces sp. SAI-127 TaxID=2940543 RepID=UPI0024746DA5|nr:hypothetical protein [Streptomyces sp. SAI-127]
MPGPAFEWPEEENCPNCSCCFRELCQRGAARTGECVSCVRPEYRMGVFGCPCSSPLLRGTAAWRAERIRATVRATECPLPPCVEVILRALAQGEVAEDRQALGLLRVGGFAQDTDDGEWSICELGQVYLDARHDPRLPACVEVLSVDKTARLAQVTVGAWDPARPVPVLLSHLTDATGLPAEELPGVWLEADVNCHAQEPDDLVLTKVRLAEPLAQGAMDPEQTVTLQASDVALVGGEQA